MSLVSLEIAFYQILTNLGYSQAFLSGTQNQSFEIFPELNCIHALRVILSINERFVKSLAVSSG